MDARYVFRISIQIVPVAEEFSLSPETFETRLYRAADPPGEDGWLFFRDHLWRGELNDPNHFRRVASEALSVPVGAISFSELQADEDYLNAMRAAIEEDLALFRAESVREVLSKYFGSSIRVED